MASFLLAAFGLFLRSSACTFDEVANLRSDLVKDSFELAKLDGKWYEQSYHDLAQVASKCQTIDARTNLTTGGMMTNFSVIYGFGPFTIAEEYTAHGPAGVFRKRAHPPAHVPGLNLPTAVVDVVQDAKGDYEGLIMYSCWSGLKALEIFTREPVVTEEVADSMNRRALARGVQLAMGDIKRVNRSGCSDREQPGNGEALLV
ncbi:unnamed protein product [Effrenium voratum]|nr:unnamed protein product [Effrenium voratum]